MSKRQVTKLKPLNPHEVDGLLAAVDGGEIPTKKKGGATTSRTKSKRGGKKGAEAPTPIKPTRHQNLTRDERRIVEVFLLEYVTAHASGFYTGSIDGLAKRIQNDPPLDRVHVVRHLIESLIKRDFLSVRRKKGTRVVSTIRITPSGKKHLAELQKIWKGRASGLPESTRRSIAHAAEHPLDCLGGNDSIDKSASSEPSKLVRMKTDEEIQSEIRALQVEKATLLDRVGLLEGQMKGLTWVLLNRAKLETDKPLPPSSLEM